VENESATLQDYLALFRRRRAVMFAAFSVLCITLVFGTLLLQDQYQSTATIAIERAEIPENMIRTTFTYFDTDLRIDRIRDRVLSAANVESWVDEHGLYKDIVAELGLPSAVAQFRGDVEVITIQAREDIAVKKQGETIAFDLSYFGETPTKAVAVTMDLATAFLDENRASRSASVQDTLAFFRRDAERLELKIEEVEQKLADFKELHVGALPNSATSSTQTLDRYDRDLADIEREMRALRERRQILETDLSTVSPFAPIFSETGEVILSGPDRLKLLQTQLVELSAKYGPQHPDVRRLRREIELLSGGDATLDSNVIRQELEVARRELAAGQQRYSPDHPDVVNAATKVRTLEAQLASATSSSQTRASQMPDNPEFIAIQVQINAIDAELYALRTRATELRDKISQFENQIARSPQVEREYLALEREYNQVIFDYNEIREKQTEAQRALDLETSEKGERYVLQRTPAEPTRPAFPNRLAIIILGVIVAVIFSFGAVFISEALDGKVRGMRDLRNLTGMPPIAVIPVLETRQIKRRRTLAWSTSIVGVTALLIVMISIQV
jgi:succinoglycan biosynthesis transport protein ExoP